MSKIGTDENNAIKQLIRFEGSTPNLPHVAGRSLLESIAGLTMEK